MIDLGKVFGALLLLDAVLRAALILRVVMRRCPVPVSLSWILLLFFVPGLSGFFYLLAGEPRLGTHRANHYERLTKRVEEDAVVYWKKQGIAWDPARYVHASLARLSTTVSGIPPLIGNEVELLGTGGSVLDRIIQDIDASQSHCHLLFYIWQPSGKGIEVGEALIRAVERGVTCRVLVDAVGSRAFLRSKLRDRMDRAGVRVVAALPVNPFRMLLARLDLRNHRKLVVIDGQIGYCGSQNLTDESFKFRRKKKTGPWIDATVRLVGHAAHALQTVFLRDWLMDAEETFEHVEDFFREIPHGPTDGTAVHVVPSGPGVQPEIIHQAMLAMLYGAREEIIMTTPYFIPDEATKSALINAALRGVDVTLVLPDVLDASTVAAAARAHYDDLLFAGVRIFHHLEGLLHAKTATIDRQVAMVSSANFDVRSFWLNFECTLFVYDAAFASQLRFMQRHYLAEAEEIELKHWRRRPIIRRFIDNCAQLLSPVL